MKAPSNRPGGRLWKDVWEGLRAQPGRTLLSFLAIAVGSVSLTVLVAVLDGLEHRAEGLVRELGFNVFAIAARAPSPGAVAPLRESMAARLARALPLCSISTVREQTARMQVLEQSVRVVATDEQLAGVRRWPVVAGRWLDTADINRREPHAVISEALRRSQGWEVGEVVSLKDIRLVVVGVVQNGSQQADETRAEERPAGGREIFVPKTLPPVWATPEPGTDPAVDTVFVRIPESASLPQVVRRTRDLLLEGRKDSQGLEWVTPETLLASVRKLQRSIRLTAGSVTFLSLILGGTTLMSLMVANVKDRMLEIGLRRALGASRMEVAVLFVAEACLVTTGAALLGVALAHAGLMSSAARMGLPALMGWRSILVPLASAFLLGIAFSYWPARLASAVAPSEALRSE